MRKTATEYFAALGKWGFLVAALLIGDIYGIVQSYYTSLNIPQWAWWLILVAILTISPLIVFHKVRLKRGDLQQQIDQVKNTAPNIIFKKAQDYPFYREGHAIYHALQIWFVNNPRVSSDNAEAKEVTATVRFYDKASKGKLEIYGCFVQAEAYEFGGNVGVVNKIESWPPNDEPRKLQIALKWQDDQKAYGFAKESFIYSSTNDGREAIREIKEGIHYVSVHFTGTRVNQPPFWFILDNPGQGSNLSVSSPIETPNLREEGFSD